MSPLRKRAATHHAFSAFALGPYATAALAACGGAGRCGRGGLGLLDSCFRQEVGPLPQGPSPLARALFTWLWRRRPQGYRSGGNPLLTAAIEAHLDPSAAEVGNCLALTCLFLALGEGLGLAVEPCYLPDAGGRGPHVLATLRADGREIDVELTRPDGYDCPALKGALGRQRWSPQQLAAEVLLDRGNLALESGRARSALALYRRALALDSSHGRAWLNLGIAYTELGRPRRGEECFARARLE